MGTSNNDANRSEFFLTDLAVQISEIFFFGDEPPVFRPKSEAIFRDHDPVALIIVRD